MFSILTMRKSRMIRIVCILALLSFSSYAFADKATCAVLTFSAKEGVSEGVAALLTDRFTVEMDELGEYKVLNRSKMKEILQLNSIPDVCVNASCAVEAGKMLAVQYLVYGTVGKVGTMYTVNGFLVNVETSETAKSKTIDQEGEVTKMLKPGMANLARGLVGLPMIAVEEKPSVRIVERPVYVPQQPTGVVSTPKKKKSNVGKVLLISGLAIGGVAAAVAAICSD